MIGTQLGKWIIERELGRGGMGRVYLARATTDGQRAAVKVLAAELATEVGFLQRFQREIDALSQLDHPHIVHFYESGMEKGVFFYAMEYVEGRNFEEMLREQGRLSWRAVLDAALQVCPALKHAHDRGIIHRDLKPSNLLCAPDGVVKLTDFGIAKVFSDHHLTSTGGVVGTAEFLSPEQAAGKPVTRRSDLYCLGVVLYNLLTGRPPFHGETMLDLLHKHRYAQFDAPRKLVLDLPYEIDEIVCQLLEKDPARRPADALVLQRQLDSIRRKLERKANPTLTNSPLEATRAEVPAFDLDPDASPGPHEAVVMGRMMRQELERQKYGGPVARWFNSIWVLLPLFLLCVGVLVWSFWPGRVATAEQLYNQGAELMDSDNPADWDRAWKDYLEPLERRYPSHPYQQELDAYRHYREDHAQQRLALARLQSATAANGAQRFYQRGLELCRQGNIAAARQVWDNVVQTFGGLEGEKRWVRLAEQGLAELAKAAPSTTAPDPSLRAALQRARQLRDEGKRQQAEDIWQGIENLYGNDPAAKEALQEVARERK